MKFFSYAENIQALFLFNISMAFYVLSEINFALNDWIIIYMQNSNLIFIISSIQLLKKI